MPQRLMSQNPQKETEEDTKLTDSPERKPTLDPCQNTSDTFYMEYIAIITVQSFTPLLAGKATK